ncbi:hypothetical protein CC85DRAFT_283642 [Cutaneotrichosporon oleaginosum]|uniref:Uncharacterized protein n=1 Tax=Cutaneotrichosporon oleaginosum TaxID=879819 RepID=A0A0J0XTJ9_9TREE|nr:uncharacterized protein CC85DRAFT_283642 [Cutaneotrichosporon oleaginosum]KLT44406.1 hypothetical protein CC85DRAFT_283642 [Cutaneotrichosporon oleaginosum]TXT07873.1 hypothetical protein COLE_04797 [Cutaneotrichosporon oleaginosum]
MNRHNPKIMPVLSGDDTRYRRRYRALKDMVNDLSDESNLLALRVYQIQRRIYDAYMAQHGRPPPPVLVPEGASWTPLVQNATHYPADVGRPRAPETNGQQRGKLAEREAREEREERQEREKREDRQERDERSSDDEARDVDAEIEDMMDDY